MDGPVEEGRPQICLLHMHKYMGTYAQIYVSLIDYFFKGAQRFGLFIYIHIY